MEWIQLAQVVTEWWMSVNFLIPLKTWNYALHHGVRCRAFQEVCAVLLCYVRLRVLMWTMASAEATAWLFWERHLVQRPTSQRPVRSQLFRNPRSCPVLERYAVRGTPADAATCSTVVWNTKYLTVLFYAGLKTRMRWEIIMNDDKARTSKESLCVYLNEDSEVLFMQLFVPFVYGLFNTAVFSSRYFSV